MIIKENDIRGLHRLKALLSRGGVAILPAYTIYGFSAFLFDVYANKRIFKIKKRQSENPLIVVADKDYILSIACDVDLNLLNLLLNNDITVIVKTSTKMPNYVSKNSKTAFRAANTDFLKKLTRDFPITSTSINISGKNSVNDIQTILNRYRFFADAVVSGQVKNKASSIVELCKDSVKIVRKGCCIDVLKEILL